MLGILSQVSNEQDMTYEALTVYLTDVERLFNDKLLVPIHDDQKQLGKLTPNNLLLLRKPSKFTRKLFSSMATSAVVTDYILALVDQSICYSYKHEQSGYKKYEIYKRAIQSWL